MSDRAAHGARTLPILQGILPLDRSHVLVDVIAGITLAALAIPEVMGYTTIAGMPVVTGLYTIVLPISVFALLGSSRHLVVGADSATAAIMYAGLVGLAQPYSSQWVGLAGWLALITAAYLVLARVLKLGFLADFLSRTVLIGFLTGVGIQVALGQFPDMFGVTKTGSGAIAQAVNAIAELPQANTTTLAVTFAVVVVILGGKLISKKVPWALIAVVGSIAASAYLDLAAKGVTTLGDVPGGLPQLGIPSLPTSSEWSTLAATALSLFFVILAQSAATSRAYAVKYDDQFSENTDLVGLSLANVAAGFSGTFVVNGSPTKSQMVDSAGGRSQISQLTSAAIVVVVLLFLTKPLSFMPNCVLASVVFIIGIELVDIAGMRSIVASRPVEFWVALLTAAVVVGVGVEQGILLALLMSLIAHVRHSYRPHNVLISQQENGRLRMSDLSTPVETLPGLVVYHFGASLYYANAGSFQDQVLALIAELDPKPRWFVLESFAIGDVDYTAAEVMRKLIGLLKDKGIRFAMTELEDHVRAELDVSGVLADLDADAIYPSLAEAIEAYQKAYPGQVAGATGQGAARGDA